MRSKYQENNTGRPWSEIRGYLRDDLPVADWVDGKLIPESAAIAVYGTNPDGDWQYLGESTVWSYDESLNIPAGHYVRANLNADNKYEVYWQSCAATVHTLPEVPGG